MSTPRGGVAVAALKVCGKESGRSSSVTESLQGFLYACGGNDGSSSLNSCERYCPSYDKWTPIASMNKRRAGASVTVLNNRLYILGPSQRTLERRTTFRFCFVSGGFDDNSPLDSVECYDPDTNTWTMVPSMTSCRGGVGSATLGPLIFISVSSSIIVCLGGRIYSVGGHDGTTYLKTVEAYDAETQQYVGRWRCVGAMFLLDSLFQMDVGCKY